ncbi:unnamed protein product [Thelazia callipaeda]|uniref:Uncharacterized protein n=1 Tax=Thelazia callipaeda TaxID=103827 RepID=A0A0N5CSF3_THECL|nr:unnamed protein product [Thelazia callipaeda]
MHKFDDYYIFRGAIMQTITKVPLRGSTSRTPPVPPPKPNVYHLHYPNVHIAKLGQFPRTSTAYHIYLIESLHISSPILNSLPFLLAKISMSIYYFIQIYLHRNSGQLPPPPGDSDTDSGICADSDNQFSPRHLNGLVFIDDKSKLLQRNFEIPIYREHLTPESVW